VTAAMPTKWQNPMCPAIQRLLGSAGDLGSRLGLSNKWMSQAIKATGNYAKCSSAMSARQAR